MDHKLIFLESFNKITVKKRIGLIVMLRGLTNNTINYLVTLFFQIKRWEDGENNSWFPIATNLNGSVGFGNRINLFIVNWVKKSTLACLLPPTNILRYIRYLSLLNPPTLRHPYDPQQTRGFRFIAICLSSGRLEPTAYIKNYGLYRELLYKE